MRDDLHKGCKMRKEWRRVLQVVQRAADWQSLGAPAVEHALMCEAKDVLRNPVVRQAFKTTEENQDLFGPAEALRTLKGSRLADALREHAALRMSEGLRGIPLLMRSLADALGEEISAMKREIVAQARTRDPRSAKELAPRVEAVSRNAVETVIARVFDKTYVATARRPSLDLDGDLLGGI